jgi:hypothetical protein
MAPRLLLALALALLAAPSLRAQLSGVVTDAETGQPVWGAAVRLSVGGAHATTDAAGRFSVSRAAAPEDTLEVRRLGFRTARVAISGAVDAVDVALAADTMMMAAIAIVARPGAGAKDGARGVPLRDPARRGEPGLRSSGRTALAWLEESVSLPRAACVPAPEPGVTRDCVWIRGVPTPLRVYVDDALAPRGVADLAALPVTEVYRMSYDAASAVVWVETNAHVEARALAYLAARGS